MTDKVVGDDVAAATHSAPVETQQPPAPTREDGTLRTIDDGELNHPTGAASSTTISTDQLAQLLSTVNGLASEGEHEQAVKLMELLVSTVLLGKQYLRLGIVKIPSYYEEAPVFEGAAG